MRGTRAVTELLIHIVKYCEKLTYNVKTVGNDYEKFIGRENRIILDASSFYVLQIGELVTKLPPGFKAEHAQMPWRKIVDMRNRMAHGYESLKKDILWEVMTTKIPELNEECRKILRALESTAEVAIREELEAETIIYDGSD